MLASETKITARILTVTAVDAYQRNYNGKNETYDFRVYEFPNGAILVPSESTNDWFFNSRDEIDANGNDTVESVEETDEFAEFTIEELRELIVNSEVEFPDILGRNQKIRELI